MRGQEGASVAERVLPAEPDSGWHTGPAPARDDGPRMFSVPQVNEIQQQADSLMAAGHTDKAIDLLRNPIGTPAGAAPGVWLDLLQIYGRAGRREDYETLRSEFEATFRAPVPGYHGAAGDSKGLEDFPRTLSRIVGLWPSPKVVVLIEELLFSKRTMADGKPLDLAAYRELVMLYGVRMAVISGGGVRR